MADDTLKNTLPAIPTDLSAPAMKPYPNPGQPGGPSSWNEGVEKIQAISRSNIKTLQSNLATPTQLKSFQAIMSLGSRTAYKERQAQELGNIKKQFDPTKVSGGLFASIISNLEAERGGDISKIHQAHMGTYRDVQAEIQRRIEYIQKLEQDKREFMARYKNATKGATGKSKKALKREKAAFNQGYIEALQRAGSDTAYMDFTLSEIRQSIMDMQAMEYQYDEVASALNAEGVPTFPGSVADQQLNLSFT